MNLNQITTRIGELSAELLTLHNEMSFLLEGEVSRIQAVLPKEIANFRDLRQGDMVILTNADSSLMLTNAPMFETGGVYRVDMLENPTYSGDYNVLIETEDGADGVWVSHTILSRAV